MLGVGFSEIIIIAVVCFVVFGPQQLPAVMRKLAIYYRQLLNLKEDLRFQIMNVEQDPQVIAKSDETSKEVKNG